MCLVLQPKFRLGGAAAVLQGRGRVRRRSSSPEDVLAGELLSGRLGEERLRFGPAGFWEVSKSGRL